MKVVLTNKNLSLTKAEKDSLVALGLSKKLFKGVCTANGWYSKAYFLLNDKSKEVRTNPILIDFAEKTKNKHLKVIEIPFDTLDGWHLEIPNCCDDYYCNFCGCCDEDVEKVCEDYREWS